MPAMPTDAITPDTTVVPPRTAPSLTGSHATHTECKCCGASAMLEGYVDFDRDCYGYNTRRAQVRGLPIAYYRCTACEFAFTDAFDAWTPADFEAHIYNHEYPLFDPNYATVRPRNTADLVRQLARNPATRILDYGSGNGLTARLLREMGYSQVVEYDPFHGNPVKPERGGFDLVICIEVAEHSPAPLELFADLGSYVADSGVVLLSTKDMSEVNGRWTDDWYVAPRNGHVSFYTQRTLKLLGNSLGRDYMRIDSFRHLLVPRGAAA